MKKILLLFLIFSVFSFSCSIEKLYQAKNLRKSSGFEQLGFSDLARMYADKMNHDELEGIYSVSGLVVKKSKGFLSSSEREKIVEQKENYSSVAIFRDTQKSNREYFEVSLDKTFLPTQSVRGEFNKAADGNILVYKHFEPKGKILNYTFTHDADKNILEGIRTESSGNATIIFKLTYVKLFPKK
jgi:hypothetical protein